MAFDQQILISGDNLSVRLREVNTNLLRETQVGRRRRLKRHEQ